MNRCVLCERLKGKNIYEDDKVVAFLDDKPMSLGHLVIVPREHYPIMEQVPDFVVEHLFKIVNKLGTAVFESLGAHGTNILINNGVPAGQEHSHFSVNIIPRRENDNINFDWQPKQLNEEEMSTAELGLKEETKFIGSFEKEKKKPISLDKETEKISGDEENYMIKQLKKLP